MIGKLGEKVGLHALNANRDAQYYGTSALVSTAGAIAGAATRSLIDGSNFGDNIIASLPSIIGQTIGEAIARSACFTAGTHIHTPDGPRAIEDIRVGDWVWARNDRFDGDASLHRRQVLELHQFEDRRTLSVTVARGVDEDIIHTTSSVNQKKKMVPPPRIERGTSRSTF